MKILVLDANQRSALAVTRSLGRLPDVQVTTADACDQALAGCSRYSHAYLQSPSPDVSPREYLQWLKAVSETTAYNLVMPVAEITSQLILMNLDQLPGVRIPFADYRTVMKLADKGQLMALAADLGIPIPSSRYFAAADQLDPAAVTQFPVVLKPCVSRFFTGERWVSTQVHIIYSVEQLRVLLSDLSYLHAIPFMLQSYIPGKGAGVFCLYQRGRMLASFAHRRLREKPPEGGVSVLSESCYPEAQLLDYARQLLDAVGWHGVAMVEFRVTPEGQAYLMEVNTRFWGSLQLAIDAGVDFPRILWDVEQGLLIKTTPGEYREGQRLRWLLGDLDSLYLFLRGTASPGDKCRRILDFVTPRFRHSRHEINRLDDMGPAWCELKQYLAHFFKRQ